MDIQEYKSTAGFPLFFLLFLAGLLINYKINIFGELYAGEFLLLLLGIVFFLQRGRGRLASSKVFKVCFVLSLLLLLGLCMSDLYRSVKLINSLKGWGRTILFCVDTLFLSLLVADNIKSLTSFAYGYALGGIASLALQSVPFSVWKLGYGEHVAVLAVLLVGGRSRLLGLLIVCGVGVYTILADYRSLGAALVVTSFLCFVIKGKTDNRSYGPFVIKLLFGVLVSVSFIYWALAFSGQDHAERRFKSVTGRMNGIEVALQAIIDSPLIGHGSWTISKKYGDMLYKKQREIEKKTGAPIGRSDLFRPHSELLQSWVEGGILSALLFLYVLMRLPKAINSCMLYQKTNPVLYFIIFQLIIQAWHILFSPFGGISRINLSITVAMLAYLDVSELSILQKQNDMGAGYANGVA